MKNEEMKAKIKETLTSEFVKFLEVNYSPVHELKRDFMEELRDCFMYGAVAASQVYQDIVTEKPEE